LDRVPDPLLLRKSGSAENRNRDLWVCSQEVDIYKYIYIYYMLHGTVTLLLEFAIGSWCQFSKEWSFVIEQLELMENQWFYFLIREQNWDNSLSESKIVITFLSLHLLYTAPI
jgi:hypothetical protein